MPALVAFVATADGRAALVPEAGPEDAGPLQLAGPVDQVVARAAALEAGGSIRWVWWSAGADAAALASAGVPVARCWDVAEAHRLLVGGWEATPQVAWAAARDLDRAALP